jgi:hypothetical protein
MHILSRRFPLISSFIFAALLLVLSPAASRAAGLVQCDEAAKAGEAGYCSLCSLFATVKEVYNFASRVTLVLAIAYVLWGGYEIMISGAKPALYASGVKRIKNAFLGVFIVLAAWFLVNAFIVGLTGTGSIYGFPWNELQCQ